MLTDIPRVAGPFIATGAAQVMPFGFRVFLASEVDLVLRDPATSETEDLVQGTHFTVSLNSDQRSSPGGSITLIAGAADAGKYIYLVGSTNRSQELDLLSQGRLWPQSIEDALDRLTAIVQEVDDKVNRAIVDPIGGPIDDGGATLTQILSDIETLQASVDGIVSGGISQTDYQAILARLAALEGGVTAPPPSPPPGPPPPSPPPASGEPVETIVFNDIGDLPTGVTVARTGDVATSRLASNAIAVNPADTLRYEYSSGGTLLGLLCEKAATNLVANGRSIETEFITFGGTTTMTGGQSDPNGGTEATRVEIAAASTGLGIRKGISGVSSARRYGLWGRSRTGVDQQIAIRRTSDGADWTPHVLTASWSQIKSAIGTGPIVGDWFNFDIVAPTAAAVDVDLWCADFQLTVAADSTLVASAGAGATRGKEVVSVTLADDSVTRDIRITFHDSSTQAFPSQAIPVGGVWEIDADDLTGFIIKQIDVYEEGALEADPGDTGGGGAITVRMADVLADMQTPATLGRSNGTTNGFYHTVIFSNNEAMRDAIPAGEYDFASACDSLITWTVISEGAGNTAVNTRVRVRFLNVWLLLDSFTGTWFHSLVDNVPRGQMTNINDANGQTGDQIYVAGVQNSVRPRFGENYELWGQPFHYRVDKALMQRVRGVYIESFLDLILHDPAGTDDRAGARYIAAQGCDWYSQVNQQSGFLGSRKDNPPQYPKHVMDGGYGKFKQVQSAGAWHTYSPIEGYYLCGIPPPWGNWSGDFEYSNAPWVMTEAQFRANPPPHLLA